MGGPLERLLSRQRVSLNQCLQQGVSLSGKSVSNETTKRRDDECRRTKDEERTTPVPQKWFLYIKKEKAR